MFSRPWHWEVLFVFLLQFLSFDEYRLHLSQVLHNLSGQAEHSQNEDYDEESSEDPHSFVWEGVPKEHSESIVLSSLYKEIDLKYLVVEVDTKRQDE